MGAVRSTAARARAHPRDDLERISGIGPAIARRLEHAGISTYEDLAASTVDALSALLDGLGGTSAARIAENDWIGQARRLGDAGRVSHEAHRTASFGIDLLLETNDAVRRTTVHDGQTGADLGWDGWDADRLLTALRPTIAPAQAAGDAVASDAPDEPPASAEPHVSRLASARPGTRRGAAGSDDPTTVTMELAARAAETPVRYTAEVAARRLDGRGEVAVTCLGGVIRPGEHISHASAGRSLAPGLYRLVAVVRANAIEAAPSDPPIWSETVSGELIPVADAASADDTRAGAQEKAAQKLLARGLITEQELAALQAT